MTLSRLFAVGLVLGLVAGCAKDGGVAELGTQVPRDGDEIMVAGQLFNTGTRVVLWTDPDGYDAYRTERRFSKWSEADWDATVRSGEEGASVPSEPQRYNTRFAKPTSLDPLTEDEIEQVRGGGWTLPMLQDRVDQFVLHYDVCGLSALCFDVLHDRRGLSVHFLLDIDGTIYQTMDLKERAWHATISNDRSVGIEIANMGAYALPEDPAEPLLPEWYSFDGRGPYITIPERMEKRYGPNGGVLDLSIWPLRPATSTPVVGTILGGDLRQWDLTEPQYEALIKLTAALNVALPKIKLDYPRDADGNAVDPNTLSPEDWEKFQGVLGHWHVQDNKIDPGPALDWERVIEGAKALR